MTDLPPFSAVERESLEQIEAYFDRLWPLPRSITGDGVRQTHNILNELVTLRRIEIPTGTRVFDWEIPSEWRVRAAYIVGPEGQRLVDYADNNLHLVNYSRPFRGRLSLADLNPHLHTIPDLPTAIPYLTSYYAPQWGFCLSAETHAKMTEGDYEVVVDTELINGSLTMSDSVLPGSSGTEVLISTYTCHPSLANNELSGPLVAAFLYRRLAQLPQRRLTFRFVFVPETIGAIAYLSLYGDHLVENLEAGYVLTCVGTKAPFTLKRSRRGDSAADRAAEYVLTGRGEPFRTISFSPSGSDERQYCSPGFNLPVSVVTRSFTEYPEYHSSLDNKQLICFEAIRETVDVYFEICRILDSNIEYRSLKPNGEPFLTRYQLQSTLGGQRDRNERLRTLKWLLNLCDGQHDLLAIAERSGSDYWLLQSLADECTRAGLLVGA